MNFKEKILNALKIDETQFIELTREITLDDLENPLAFKNIDLAVNRIKKAIDSNEKIMIYGDYDCDGISSVSILVNTFKQLNYEVGYYIPNRYKDGYGINEKMVDVIHSKGYKVIITVDNGVSQMEALTKAKNYGIDVILTDHHEMLKEIPPCYCLVHPFVKDSNILSECGAYVSFMLSCLLLNKIDHYLLCLASLATISDLMPLKGYNRIIVKNAINILNNEEINQFKILIDSKKIDEKALGFSLAPKINAIGRVKEDNSVNKVVRYFVTNDVNERIQLANFINSVNDQRKSMCSEAYGSLDFSDCSNDKVIVKYIPSLKEGLIGLIAGRILNIFNKPVIIFTKSENGLLKGSGRSLEGFSLGESFCKLSHLLEVYGGHALAGGLSIKEENLSEFIKQINFLAEDKIIKPKAKNIIDMDQDDFTYENYQILKKLSPFGEEFEEPYFQYQINVNQISFIGNMKQHIRGIINKECTFIHFNVDKSKLNKEYVTLIGHLEEDYYRGGHNISFNVEEII